MRKSIAVGIIHAAIVLSVWLNDAWQQTTLPRAWARTASYDPYDLMHGRYVQLRVLAIEDAAARRDPGSRKGKLFVEGGHLHIRQAVYCLSYSRERDPESEEVRLAKAVSFYIPEGIPDSSRLEAGDELWVELSVPKTGELRPVQLARKKKDGSWMPLRLSLTNAGTK